MNGLYFLLPFLLVASIGLSQEAFAERLEDSEKIINPDGSITHSLGLPPYINTVNGYQPFVFTDDNVFLTVETGHGSVRLNKNTCGFGIYAGGYIETPIFDIEGNVIGTNIADPDFNSMINAWKKNNNGPAFQNLASLNGGSCVTSWDGENLSATQTLPGTAEKTVTFTLQNYNWKTTYEITNLDSQSNTYAFKDFITISSDDSISINGDDKKFSTYSGQTFDKNWLENNNGKFFSFDKWIYDFDIGFDYLQGVNMKDTGVELEFVSPEIAPLDKWVVDPTFGYYVDLLSATVFTADEISADCSNIQTNGWGQAMITQTTRNVSPGGYCTWNALEFELTDIPSNAQITDVVWKYDISARGNPRNCDVNEVNYALDGGASLWNLDGDVTGLYNYMTNGTNWLSNNTFCTQAVADNYTLDLGTTADTHFQETLDGGFNHFQFSWYQYDMTKDGANHYTWWNDNELQVTYNI